MNTVMIDVQVGGDPVLKWWQIPFAALAGIMTLVGLAVVVAVPLAISMVLIANAI